ncbi:hypothetical protein V5O48_002161 [Marasmius crinis-equi]|uniref:Uncharacterized protein n=1 Tax=Marasmius crinis-equi TaxID=585013 RepID=A0ABR3FWE8_9AGAR
MARHERTPARYMHEDIKRVLYDMQDLSRAETETYIERKREEFQVFKSYPTWFSKEKSEIREMFA